MPRKASSLVESQLSRACAKQIEERACWSSHGGLHSCAGNLAREQRGVRLC